MTMYVCMAVLGVDDCAYGLECVGVFIFVSFIILLFLLSLKLGQTWWCQIVWIINSLRLIWLASWWCWSSSTISYWLRNCICLTFISLVMFISILFYFFLFICLFVCSLTHSLTHSRARFFIDYYLNA
jgi:Fe2+ transport system protein B